MARANTLRSDRKRPLLDLPRRLPAVDSSRGSFIAFAVVACLVPAAARELPGGGALELVSEQMAASANASKTLWDLLAPGFLFTMGPSAAVSIERHRAEGETPAATGIRLLRRCALLFLIGLALDGGVPCAWSDVRWLGPWQRIAICNLCVGALCRVLDWKGLAVLAWMIIAGYGLALEGISFAPAAVRSADGGPGDVRTHSSERSLVAEVDRRFLPGRKYFGDWDPYGLLTTAPALAIALLGAAGRYVLVPALAMRPLSSVRASGPTAAEQPAPRGAKAMASKVELPVPKEAVPPTWDGLAPFLVAFALINAGLLLGDWQPVDASLLTPAFVLVATGIFALLFGILSVLEGSRACSRPVDFLARLGRNSLGLMVVLHVFAKHVSPRLLRAAHAAGLSKYYPATVLAITGMALLWWLSWWFDGRRSRAGCRETPS